MPSMWKLITKIYLSSLNTLIDTTWLKNLEMDKFLIIDSFLLKIGSRSRDYCI